ncbi:NCS1 nucleoside transporter family [Pisolithus albus]|nr:NCS1 nucleoside transporter family [Pisolithus albus]
MPFSVLNPGAIFHVTFLVVNRTSFDIFGSLWCVLNLSAMARGTRVLVMLRAIWHSNMNDMPERLQRLYPRTHLDSPPIQCQPRRVQPFGIGLHVLFPLPQMSVWVLSFTESLHLIDDPTRGVSRHLFAVQMIVTPIAETVFFPASIHGSSLAWAMVMSLMSCITLHPRLTSCRNAPDFASRAKTPGAALRPQLSAIPLTCSIVCLMGIPLSQVIFGEATWSPVDLLGSFLNGSHLTRVWFMSASFIIAQDDISANSVSAGCDLTALFPRFIALGFCMCPWSLLKSSNSSTSYLSSYSVCLSSIAGVMNIYVIRKGHFSVADLYATGVNLRAYAAYITGILINVVGSMARVRHLVATRIYELSFFTEFGQSSVVYYVLSRGFPVIAAAGNFEVDESGTRDIYQREGKPGAFQTTALFVPVDMRWASL